MADKFPMCSKWSLHFCGKIVPSRSQKISEASREPRKRWIMSFFFVQSIFLNSYAFAKGIHFNYNQATVGLSLPSLAQL